MSEEKKFLVIAVDGGAASGKSSTSRALAKAHRLMHVDTGAHYRTVALPLLRRGIVCAEDFFASEKPLEDLDLGTVVRGNEAYMSLNGIVPDRERYIMNNEIRIAENM